MTLKKQEIDNIYLLQTNDLSKMKKYSTKHQLHS